jgi:hypothetical protein
MDSEPSQRFDFPLVAGGSTWSRFDAVEVSAGLSGLTGGYIQGIVSFSNLLRAPAQYASTNAFHISLTFDFITPPRLSCARI